MKTELIKWRIRSEVNLFSGEPELIFNGVYDQEDQLFTAFRKITIPEDFIEVKEWHRQVRASITWELQTKMINYNNLNKFNDDDYE